MPVTKDQAEMLAHLAVAARPHGARRWDPPGVIAAIAKVRHLDLAEVIKTVGRAAGDRDLDTPAAIGNPANPCWIERPVERWTPDKTSPDQRCGICNKTRETCEATPRFADDDHTFEPDFKTHTGSAVDELRDIKAKATTPTVPDAEEATTRCLTPTADYPTASPTHTSNAATSPASLPAKHPSRSSSTTGSGTSTQPTP